MSNGYLETYQRLRSLEKEISLLASVESLLMWDNETQIPQLGTTHRADQLSYISGLKHERATSPMIGELLGQLEEGVEQFPPGSDGSVNLREWRRSYDRATKIPRDLVEQLSHTAVLSRKAWAQARSESNFNLFKLHLEKTLDLKRQVAELIGYEDEPYEALMDEYEPGAKTVEVEKILHDLRQSLVPLLLKIQESPWKPDVSVLKFHYPIEQQESFARQVVSSFGYDFQRGRLDLTTHPFCIELGPHDIRITARYNERFFPTGFFSILHEAGHGIYEQNLPAEHWGAPLGTAVSLGIHESQSRLWENFVGRSLPFWEYWYPQLQQRFHILKTTPLDTFYSAINEVRPSFIRVEADEMTYNLHVLLRFEIERAMVSGKLAVKDVPEFWNTKFEEYFGLPVPNDAMGCLQDVHWAEGLFGYFPTYTLGNLMAAQLWESAAQSLGDLSGLLRKGEYTPLHQWLNEQIYSQGMRYRSRDLIKVVTGKPLEAQALVNYLKMKYGALFKIDF